jgi:hypothetical protein
MALLIQEKRGTDALALKGIMPLNLSCGKRYEYKHLGCVFGDFQ